MKIQITLIAIQILMELFQSKPFHLWAVCNFELHHSTWKNIIKFQTFNFWVQELRSLRQIFKNYMRKYILYSLLEPVYRGDVPLKNWGKAHALPPTWKRTESRHLLPQKFWFSQIDSKTFLLAESLFRSKCIIDKK